MEEFEYLCHQYKDIIYRYLLALCRDEHLSEELTAETFYRAFLHINRFRGECNVATWLCQIAKNVYYKEQKRRNKHDSLEKVLEIEDPNHFLDKLYEKEQVAEIVRSLQNLNEPYKEVFTLRVLGNLSFQEIAMIFSKTDSWARVTHYRAKEKLIHKLEGENEN